MATPILHHAALGLRSQIVRIALDEKGVAYRSVRVEARGGPTDAPGVAPVLLSNGCTLTRVIDIAEHLDAAFDGPPLHPKNDAARYDMDIWTAPITTLPDREIELGLRRGGDPEALQDRLRRVGALVDRLEEHVRGRAFIAGESWSLADAVWTGALARLKLLGLAELFAPARHPAVDAFYRRMRMRESFERGFVFERRPSPWGLLVWDRRARFAFGAGPQTSIARLGEAAPAARPGHENP